MHYYQTRFNNRVDSLISKSIIQHNEQTSANVSPINFKSELKGIE